MTMFEGASQHQLLADWVTSWTNQPEWTWASEWQTLASRGQALACNDPFAAALVAAIIQGTLGPTGLRHSSLCDPDQGRATTTEQTRARRREFNAATAASWIGRDLDADGVRTRRDLEEALAWSAFVTGDGFAIRLWRDGRSVWRIVDQSRVCNPLGKGNGPNLRDGFALDSSGKVTGIYASTGNFTTTGYWKPSEPVFIPWTAEDGTPNVIHRVGFRLPGMMRGVSRFAPMIVMTRQISGVLESHVAGKRLQAIMAMITEAESPEAWAAALAAGTAVDPTRLRIQGPLNVWVKSPDSGEVQFTDTKFNGQDLEAYLKICYRVLCAVNQVPVDVVLCQMGDAPLSSARAGLDQFDRTCTTEQERHIAECASAIDRTVISDAVAMSELSIGTSTWPQAMAGKYSRPPKYSTDRKKDADTIEKLMAVGFSGTTAFATVGADWEDEQEQRRAESEFTAAQESTKKSDAAFVQRVADAKAFIDSSGVEDLTWPIVLAAGAAQTAPGAFISALAKPEATGSASAGGDAATPIPQTEPQNPPAEDQEDTGEEDQK